MNRSELTALQRWSILVAAAAMLSLAMGMRQRLGLFQPQMVRDIGVTAAQFSMAIAIQNIVWGATQPFVRPSPRCACRTHRPGEAIDAAALGRVTPL